MFPGYKEIVSEVARRVMARLSESRRPARRAAPARRSRAEAINEVTERIMKRILKGKWFNFLLTLGRCVL